MNNKLLIRNKITYDNRIVFEMTYSDGVINRTSLKIGDIVNVTYYSNGELKELVGKLIDIKIYQKGQIGFELAGVSYSMLSFDISTNYQNAVELVEADCIRTIVKNAEVFDFKDTILSSIATGLYSALCVNYDKKIVSETFLTVKSVKDQSILFKKKCATEAVNHDAIFSWTLRDYSSISTAAHVDGLLYDSAGNYVYKEGDSSNAVVKAIEESNTYLLAADSDVRLEIAAVYTTEDGQIEVAGKAIEFALTIDQVIDATYSPV